MADSILETTAIRIVVDDSGVQQRLKRAADEAKRAFRDVNAATGPAARAFAGVGKESDSLAAKVKSVSNEVRTLRNTWQTTGQDTDRTKRRLRELSNEALNLAKSLDPASQAAARLAVAARSADATIAGMEGRMSRLGLASQVNLAAVTAMQGQLYRFGPVGQVAASSLGIAATGAQGLTTAAIATTGAVVGLAGAAYGLTRRGIPQVKEFQSALRVLVASGEDLNSAQLDSELRSIQDAAGAAGNQFDRAGLATALSELVKAGLDARSALNLLAPGMQLASVTGGDLNETTTLLLTNLRQFRLDASDAGRVADALAVADLNASESAKELSQGLSVVGPLARAAGFSLEDTLGILVELNNAGLGAADVGATALRGTLSALLDPTDRARETIAKLGVSLRDSNGNARPLLDVLRDLQAAINSNAEGAQAAAEIFDTRAITAILNMTDASSKLTGELENATGAAKEYADTFLDENLTAAQQELNAAIDDLAQTFAGTFASDIADAANALAGFLRLVDGWMGRFVETSNVDMYQSMFGTKFLDSQADRAEEVIGALKELDRQARALDNYLSGQPADLSGIAGLPRGPVTAGGNRAAVEALLAQNRAEAEALRRELFALQRAGSGPDFGNLPTPFGPQPGSVAGSVDTGAGGGGSATTTAGRVPRTIQDVWRDLNAQGTAAQQVAAAFGNTVDAQIDSVQARQRLVNRAITELITDFGMAFDSPEVKYLVNRAETLGAELEALRNPSLATAPSLNRTLEDQGLLPRNAAYRQLGINPFASVTPGLPIGDPGVRATFGGVADLRGFTPRATVGGAELLTDPGAFARLLLGGPQLQERDLGRVAQATKEANDAAAEAMRLAIAAEEAWRSNLLAARGQSARFGTPEALDAFTRQALIQSYGVTPGQLAFGSSYQGFRPRESNPADIENAKAINEEREAIRQAGEDFRGAVVNAAADFTGVLIKGIRSGDTGSIVEGLFGIGGSLIGMIPGVGFWGQVASAFLPVLGGLFGSMVPRDEEATRAPGAAVRGAPAIELNFTVNQSLSVASLTGADRRAVDGLADDLVRRLENVISRNILPRIGYLEERIA